MADAPARARRQAAKQRRRERRQAARNLRARQRAQGLNPAPKPARPNRKSEWTSPEEEAEARQEAVEAQLKVLRTLLPSLLKRFAKILDPRRPQSVKHKLTVVLLYGVLCFVYQMASRRQANQQMSRPIFLANLRELVPELESLPHNDTLCRLLARIDVEQLQDALVALMKEFLRNKKFRRYLLQRAHLIAIDGTQKFTRDQPFADEALRRRVGDPDNSRLQEYVYVLEANLVLGNGISLPLLSEFLTYPDGDVDEAKQDCELKAFRRLAKRLKACFPRLPILLLLDGLYPNGPVISLCRHYGWDFMLVWPDKVLPSLWEEAKQVQRLQPEETLDRTWGDRHQHFWWVNDLVYEYDPPEGGRRRTETLHVVVCEEWWEELDPDKAEIVVRQTRHAWISHAPLHRKNVHLRCNRAGRYRWSIEANILVEKRHGYHYEHVFSYEWQGMKGYHYLMRLGHLVNVLVQISLEAGPLVVCMGMQGFLAFVRETLAAGSLDRDRIALLRQRTHQLRWELPPAAA